MSQRSIEVKVGLLILVALGLLTGFIIIMGGLNFQPTYGVFVDFDNPGGLQSGAPVKIAGVKIGKIDEIQFRGGEMNTATGKREPLVRVKALIERRYQKSIHDNPTFFVTSQGVLGENFLSIDPGSTDRPVLPEGSITRGLDPPRLDMLLAEGYELLHTGIAAVRENKKQIGETFDGLHDTLKGTGDFFNTNKERLNRITENVEKITVSVDDLIKASKERYVDNAQINRIIDQVEKTTALISRDAEPLLKDAKEAMGNVKTLTATVGGAEQQAKIKSTISDVAEIAGRAKAAAADAQAIVAHIKHGDGSVGAMLMDEQLYDDIQEMVRDLKHNPWKLFWRE